MKLLSQLFCHSIYAWCLSQTAVCTTTEEMLCASRIIPSADDGYLAQGCATCRSSQLHDVWTEVNGARDNGSLV